MKLIHRPLYINQLKDVLNTPDIKILTGIRRCGKSKLLAELIGYICSTDPKANIIDIDLKLIKNEPLREYHVLYNFITSHYRDGATNYLMIDEVQMCKNFELAVNSLYSEDKYRISFGCKVTNNFLRHIAKSRFFK